MRPGRRPHVFETEINLPESLSHVFAFFADAQNLEKLTPPWLKFSILTPEPIRMKVGTLIDYRLRIRGMPVYWRTRITVWDPPHRFVDQQVCGPYRLWIHEHTFDEDVGQTLAQDRVEYDVPLGILESICHCLLVCSHIFPLNFSVQPLSGWAVTLSPSMTVVEA